MKEKREVEIRKTTVIVRHSFGLTHVKGYNHPADSEGLEMYL